MCRKVGIFIFETILQPTQTQAFGKAYAVTTIGYIVSVLGPYLADSKNIDANILKYMIRSNERVGQRRGYLRCGQGFHGLG